MPTEEQIRELAFTAIDNAATVDGLLQSDGVPSRVPVHQLYAYAADPAFHADADFLMRLNADPKARADLSALMRRLGWSHMPRLAAAATGESTKRETPRAEIMLMPSRSDDGTVYLIVTLKDADGREPQRLSVIDGRGQVHDIRLGGFANRRVQLMISSDDPMISALRDAGAEVTLI